MKRIWPYLGAVFPITSSSPASGAAGFDGEDAPQAMRLKSDRTNEEEKRLGDSHEEAEPGAKSPSSAHAPSHGASDDTGDASNRRAAGGDHDYGDPLPQKAFVHANADHGAHAPDSAVKAIGGGGGGGGGGGAVMSGGSKGPKPGEDGEDGEGTPPPDGSDGSTTPGTPTTPDDVLPGYVDSDPADAHAMSILLGGTATGSGAGATSSGEVNLDIVDLGPVTVGYGFAKYKASGEDGATADTFAAVEGADTVFMFGFDSDYLPHHSSESGYSMVYVIALDFEDDADAAGLESSDSGYWLAQAPWSQWLSGSAGAPAEEADVSVDGNTGSVTLGVDVQDDGPVAANASTLSVDGSSSGAIVSAQSEQAWLLLNASVSGIDTYASANGSLVEINDHFSSVSGIVIGVG